MKTGHSARRKLAIGNRKHARMRWGPQLNKVHLSTLRELSMQFGFSLAMGDVMLLEGRSYVTHTSLIRLARHNRCAGIHVRPVPEFSDSAGQRWAFEATVYKSRAWRGFVGYGDADPSNVSPVVHGAEMRVAETPCCEPRPAQGLRHWYLLNRGNRVLCRIAGLSGIDEATITAC